MSPTRLGGGSTGLELVAVGRQFPAPGRQVLDVSVAVDRLDPAALVATESRAAVIRALVFGFAFPSAQRGHIIRRKLHRGLLPIDVRLIFRDRFFVELMAHY